VSVHGKLFALIKAAIHSNIFNRLITNIKKLGDRLGAKVIEVFTLDAQSTSFWRQDVNWYVSQQGWTRSFRQVDQNWNQELSGDSSSASTASTATQAGESGSASIVNPNAFGAQIDSGWLVALQSSVSGNSNSTFTTEKTGSLLDLIA
jgi:anionic cell wall polymer biosynthesis LytR-Cps2A-Psr (LCP) family protein